MLNNISFFTILYASIPATIVIIHALCVVAALSAGRGVRSGALASIGAIAGFFIHILLINVMFADGKLQIANFKVMNLIVIAYLVWMIIVQIRALRLSEPVPEMDGKHRSYSLVSGFVVTFFDAQMSIFGLALLPMYFEGGIGGGLAGIGLMLGLAMCLFGIFAVASLGFGVVGKSLRRSFYPYFDKVISVAFLMLALILFIIPLWLG